jgi:hypothetical protein
MSIIRSQQSADVWELQRNGIVVTDDAAAEMRRQVELRHEALYRAALGLDQRASVIGAAFAAVAAAIAGGFIAAEITWNPAAVAGAALLVGGFASAAGLCFHAARPVPFRMPGLRASVWISGEWLADTQRTIDLAVAAETEDALVQAHAVQTANGRWLAWGLRVASATAPLAGSAYLVLSRLISA